MSGVGLFVGGAPVTAVYVGSTPVKAVYVGSELVWSATVQITLGTGLEAQAQFRAALAERGLNYQTIKYIPFDIEFVGTGSAEGMFRNCYALTSVPAMDTSNVTRMVRMFQDCSSLTTVPDMDTAQVTNVVSMFSGCSSLTDGNVRLIGRHPQVDTTNMISGSGLTFEPFYEVVKITLGTSTEARTQLRAALGDRGLDYRTVTELPFVIELVGSGSVRSMFLNCSSLTTAPDLDTSQVTDMNTMFQGCSALTSVPDMDTSSVTNASYMFYNCSALTDGNVRLIGRNPNVNTTGIITGSGLTREPWYTADGKPIDVYEVTLTDVSGTGTVHPLLTVTVPAGETWSVQIQGTVTKADQISTFHPSFRIGTANSGKYGQGDAVDFSGTVTAANSTIAMVTSSTITASFTGTVTITRSI